MLPRDNLIVIAFVFATMPKAVAADPPVATKNSTSEERLAYMQLSGESYLAVFGENERAKFQKKTRLEVHQCGQWCCRRRFILVDG